jgi:hypothetical protein
MPSISISIGGNGRTRTISSGDLANRLLPAMRYLAGNEPLPQVVDPIADAQMIEAWADDIISSLQSSVYAYEDSKRTTTPLVLT